MNKSTKTFIMVIGALVFLAGITRFFQGDKIDALLAIVIGASLIGSAYYTKPAKPKDE